MERLRMEKEQLELEINMASNMAKMKVLGSKRSCVSVKSKLTD